MIAALTGVAGAQPTASFEDFAGWDIADRAATRMIYLDRPSLFLQNGVALAPDAPFVDGTIDFDVAVHGQPGFAGVVFRAASGADYELVYLRTHRSRQWDALQYTPVFHGDEGWQLYTGDGFNAAAEIPANRWVHVRVIIAGRTTQVFVDGATVPQLTITDLKRPVSSGRAGLWGRFGSANFSNFKVTPAERLAPEARPVTRASGAVSSWTISQAFPGATVSERVPETIDWERVEAEPSGLLNIARYRTLADPRPGTNDDGRTTVFARAVLRVSERRTIKMSFGYSDDVTIFVDGAPRFAGRAGYLSRDGSYLGTLTFNSDALYVDFMPGRHELIFAVTEAFGGWGVAATFEPAGAVTIE